MTKQRLDAANRAADAVLVAYGYVTLLAALVLGLGWLASAVGLDPWRSAAAAVLALPVLAAVAGAARGR